MSRTGLPARIRTGDPRLRSFASDSPPLVDVSGAVSSAQGFSVNERESASSSDEMNSPVNSPGNESEAAALDDVGLGLICEVFGQPEKGRAIVVRHEASGAVVADVWEDPPAQGNELESATPSPDEENAV